MLRDLDDYRGAINGTCPDEPQFRQMYEVLGDADALRDVRLSYPKVQHCEKLEINPRACNGCPKNPMKPEKLAKRERVEVWGYFLELARQLDQKSKFGLLSVDNINSTDMLILTMHRERSEYERDERLAILFRNQIADVLGKMFGAK